ARDILFLRTLAERHGLPDNVFAGVVDANAAHRGWTKLKLADQLKSQSRPDGATVAIWGLTYKPGTDTLRRSGAIELCRWLLARGVTVSAHDPAVKRLPADLTPGVSLCESPLEAVRGAAALAICTAWPEYAEVSAERVLSELQRPVVIDAAGFTARSLGAHPGIRYVRVGAAAVSAPGARGGHDR